MSSDDEVSQLRSPDTDAFFLPTKRQLHYVHGE